MIHLSEIHVEFALFLFPKSSRFTSMRHLVLTFLCPFIVGADESDGCWKQIPNAAIVSVQGSSGYSVTCTPVATPTTAASAAVVSDAASTPLTAVEVGDFKDRRRVRHRGPLRVHHPQGSLIQDSASDTTLYQVCLTPSDSAPTGSMSAQFQLTSQYIVRGAAIYDPSTPSALTPSGFTLNTQSTSTSDSVWYSSITDQDSGNPWSTLPVDVSNMFNRDMSGQYINVFPKLFSASSSSPAPTSTAFGISFMGCTVEQTALVSFRFQSSKNAIASRFGLVSTFISDLTNYVCLMSGFVTSAGPCSRIVYADMEESTSPNPDLTADTPFQPQTVTTLEVFFRILPPNIYACTDCRSAQNVQTSLETDLQNPSSKNAQILQAIDAWIADPDPFMCHSKTCPAGYLCVDGVCLTAMDVLNKEATSLSVDSATLFQNSTTMDQILNLSPLQVITGVDQSQGRIVFSNNPPAAGTIAGTVSSAAAESTSSTTDDESFVQRFMIPIIVVSVFTLAILGILGWKAYTRMQQGGSTGTSGGGL